ncbi:MAG: hypothetical protein JWM54_2335, partial [Acidobacteriaceae bacterium]|nr:hypothetical protein [Acidobacteriaceae bacterium]
MSRRETSAWNPVPIEIGPVLARKYRYAFFLVPCLLAGLFVMAALRTFKVDDAFMFYRYALHFRQGLGVAWNPDGVPTYGLTSLGWFLIVLLFSFLPLKAVAVLILASGATGMLALLLMSWGITRFAVSHAMRSLWVALPLVALPLLLQPQFDLEIINGMETMLSVLTNALLVLAVLYAMRQPTTRSAVLLGLSGYLAFFVRPDNGLCAALVPLMLWLFWSPFQFRIALVAELCLFSLIGVQLLLAYRYFGTPVPLAFYIKAIGGYKGYIPPVNPGVQFSSFLFFAAPYLG